ncbi:MAG: AIR synthase-related protein, partial [Vicinamibacteria bacterium]
MPSVRALIRHRDSGIRVGEVMSTPPITVDAAAPLAEAARNVACAGGVPIGATNNLNFGNPERPEIMGQFGEAVRGIGDACRALDVPVTGGNVSLYNETEGRAIYPTPVLGIVGLLEDAARTVTRRFQTTGARLLVLGDNRGELGGSEYLARVYDVVAGAPPRLDLAAERALQQLIVALVRERLVQSAHDCSEGGLAVAVAECAFDTGGIGATIDVPAVDGVPHGFATNATLFGESASRIVISVAPEAVAKVVARAGKAGVPVHEIGETGGDRLRFAVGGQGAIDMPVADAETRWATAIERKMAR